MLQDFIIQRIRQELPFAPNEGQAVLLAKLARFLVAPPQTSSSALSANPCFLLRGYAGTGKTSIVAALTRALKGLKRPFCLLAPTGRAAKVLAAYSGFPAFTIHKRIYRRKQLGSDDYSLAPNFHPGMLFIVDEASMLGGDPLLTDLLRFVFSAQGCSLLLLGDDAQLPPVGQTYSPALSVSYLQSCGLTVMEHTLTEVARQALDSGILAYATELRERLNSSVDMDSLLAGGSVLRAGSSPADVRSVYDQDEFLQELERAYREVGLEDVLLITRSNKRTNLYNQGVRNQILGFDGAISGGDRIMVSKNNYFWLEDSFLANGDMLRIEHLHNQRELYGFQFVDASLRALDYDCEIDATLWLDTFFTDTPEDNARLHRELFQRIAEDYPEIRNKRELTRKVYESPYFNAIQARFAYAVTCHKAQGGQWKRVFVDPGALLPSSSGDSPSDGISISPTEFTRWLYTAVTRAQENLFLINFPPRK